MGGNGHTRSIFFSAVNMFDSAVSHDLHDRWSLLVMCNLFLSSTIFGLLFLRSS